MAEALIETNNDVSSVVKGNPSQYVKLNVGGSLHYTTIGWFKKSFLITIPPPKVIWGFEVGCFF